MKNPKIGEGLRRFYREHGHPGAGKPGRKQSVEERSRKAEAVRKSWDLRGRLTIEQKKAGNKANVYRYRARKYNAIPPDADLELIKRIYLACPSGYQVDHRIALTVGGLHHQDNLQYLPATVNRQKGKYSKYDESLAIQWKDFVNSAPG